jgi:hypothetical protein
MGGDTLSFEEHRRRRDENPSLVRCARCGKMILATVTGCPECGVHFQGQAQEYLHPSERPTNCHAGWVVVLAVVLALVTVISVLALM